MTATLHCTDPENDRCPCCGVRLRDGKKEIDALTADRNRLLGLLGRCRTILANMALEREGAIFRRWPINHEPLRGDAKGVLPLIDAAIEGNDEQVATFKWVCEKCGTLSNDKTCDCTKFGNEGRFIPFEAEHAVEDK